LLQAHVDHDFNHSVSCAVTKGVVDVLEVIQIEQHHADLPVDPVCLHQRALELILEFRAIWKSGQRIFHGHTTNSRFRLYPVGDIRKCANRVT